MGTSSYWYRFVGDGGAVLGVDRFGASAPAAQIIAECGFTVSNIQQQLKSLLQTV